MLKSCVRGTTSKGNQEDNFIYISIKKNQTFGNKFKEMRYTETKPHILKENKMTPIDRKTSHVYELADLLPLEQNWESHIF